MPWQTFTVDDTDGEPTEKDLQKAAVYPEVLGAPQYVSTALTLGSVGVVTAASMQVLGTWLWGALAVIPAAIVHAEPVSGTAYTRVANGQRRKAFATAFYEDYQMKQLANIPELLSEVFRLRGERDSVAEEVQELKDSSIIEQANDPDAFGGSRLIEEDGKSIEDIVEEAMEKTENGSEEATD